MSGRAPPRVVVEVAVPVPLHRSFDYLPPAAGAMPEPGVRVRVPFGARKLVGVVLSTRRDSPADPASLKPIAEVLPDGAVPPELLDLLRWTADYYAAPPGEIVTHALPPALRRTRAFRRPPPDWWRITDAGRSSEARGAPRRRQALDRLAEGPAHRDELEAEGIRPAVLRALAEAGLAEACDPPAPEPVPGPELNSDQRTAVAAALRARHRFEALLLAGVTGSGKTEVYLQAARALMGNRRQVLMLLPEIGLTPQLVRRIEARLGQRAWTYHSGLSEGERVATWEAAASGRARLLVGTRSAVFLPLKDPALIVVDEEHDASFKQFDGMRYHGRDVAVMRASRLGIPVMLGTATPSLESLSNAGRGRYRQVELPKRAGASELPRWRIEDLRGQSVRDGLGERLRDRIGKRLANGDQVLVYRNRRGYAPVLVCEECGWQADCERCSAHLTWHRARGSLDCHHCGHRRPAPPRCPSCQSPRLVPAGAGTQRIEQALAAAFPDVPVHRVDRDSVRGKDELESLLAEVMRGEPCILVGTQMLAKGHHLPAIGLAVVLDADQALFSADFRAPERLAQTVFQVAGRAGRGRPGEFLLQTRHPEHPLIRELARGAYLDSAGLLLAERDAAELPPAWSLAMVRAEARDAADARRFLSTVAGRLDGDGLRVAGPLQAILQRRAGHWRYQLWLMAERRATLRRALAGLPAALEALPEARRVRWHLDVDPLEM